MSGRKLPVLRSVTLTVTERCNLRCAYCYVPVDRGRTMSPEVGDAAVDMFAAHADPEARLSLSFFGGEPFLAPSLLRRSIERARAKLPATKALRVVTPTNGVSLDDEALDLCREEGIELAVSLDGDARTAGRPFAGGEPSAPTLLERLPKILALGPSADLTARMTVTPDNVSELASNVRAVARLGFRRVVFLPAFEERWDDAAVEAWGREHRRIGTWLVGAWGTGQKVPDLPSWRGVEARLLQGKPRRACGAGERLAAVATDGRVMPCYRFVFEPDEKVDGATLGDVRTGEWNDEALARFSDLDPERSRPAHGDCATCAAHDGCTHFCPAMGFLATRDPLFVPDVACRLMRAQVAAIREYAALQRRPPRPQRRPARARWAAAAVLVVTASTSSAACGGVTEIPAPAGDALADGADTMGPGVCADIGPGVCPVWIDSGPDAGADTTIGPGICDYADTGSDTGIGPGICPVMIDTGTDTGMKPGVC